MRPRPIQPAQQLTAKSKTIGHDHSAHKRLADEGKNKKIATARRRADARER